MTNEFEKYVARYSPDLTRLCLSLCGSITDAEDLFQETWHKAIKNYSKFDRSRRFDKWLYTICVNTYKSNLRLSYNKNKIHFKTDKEKQIFLNSIPCVEEERDEYLELHEAIAALPKKQKIVITLLYFKDYSVSDISQMLNIPEGTVKSRLYHARAAIKRRLEDETSGL